VIEIQGSGTRGQGDRWIQRVGSTPEAGQSGRYRQVDGEVGCGARARACRRGVSGDEDEADARKRSVPGRATAQGDWGSSRLGFEPQQQQQQ
jgi:hypothetical protein